MTTAKIIEVSSQGASVEEAINNGVKDAGKSVKGIKSVYVKEIQAIVENQEVTGFRTLLKITFVINQT